MNDISDFDLVRERYDRLLKIPFNERTDDNLFELMRMTSKMKIFESINMSNMHKEICKNIFIKHFERGEIIFKQGDEGDAYYFVLRGAIDLYLYDIDQLDGKIKLKLITSVMSGFGFGELALLYDCPRTATAISSTKTDLIVFKKKMYNSFVKDVHEKELFEMVKFYYSIPIFKKEPISNILKFCLRTTKLTFNAYELIYRQQDMIKDFCFVKFGTVKAFLKFNVNSETLKNVKRMTPEKFVEKIKKYQLNSKNPKVTEEVLDIMEFTEKDMFAEYYAVKGKRCEVFLMPLFPTQVFQIKADDFKKINPDLFEIIDKLALPILDYDRVFTKFYENLKWQNEKEKLLYMALKKK